MSIGAAELYLRRFDKIEVCNLERDINICVRRIKLSNEAEDAGDGPVAREATLEKRIMDLMRVLVRHPLLERPTCGAGT